jgi:hypothetical protein
VEPSADWLQLGVAVPFVAALGIVGKWLLNRLDALEQSKVVLYDRIIDEVIPALKQQSEVSVRLIERLSDLDVTRAEYILRLEQITEQQTLMLERAEKLVRLEDRRARK